MKRRVFILTALVIFGKAVPAQNAGVVTAINISARATVSSGPADVLIGGFIVSGSLPKRILIRALGPSLAIGSTILLELLQDPVLELHDATGNLIALNDDWQTNQEQEIIDTTLPPSDPRESAIVVTLNPGTYTAVVRGKGSATGVALVELYDLGGASEAGVSELSTRGNVQLGDAAMIGGFIISGSTEATVLVRALGPELTASGVPGALQDTTLELRDSQGVLVAFNDDWETDKEAQILFSNEAPTDPRESAVVRTLAAGSYTVVVRGKDETVGIGLLEVYVLPLLKEQFQPLNQ